MTDNEITYQIRGAIYNVYRELGPGLLESVYEEAMTYELEKRGLTVERQLEVPIHYDGQILKTPLRLDLLVQGRIVIELKSVKELQEVFFKQTRTYLRLLGLKVGILVNFNRKFLPFLLFLRDKKRQLPLMRTAFPLLS